MRLVTIDFGSLLSYAPWGNLEIHMKSKTMKTMLKNDWFVDSKSDKVLMSEFVADEIKRNMQSLPFARLFELNPILVPVPPSSLLTKDSLWVPQRIAKALIRRGLGKSVAECVKLVKPLRKSSKSSPENRPKPSEHYDSVEVEQILSNPVEILLVDDIVTRGATLIGVANKLADVFPNADIHGFAAMRTMTPPSNFVKIYDPCIGKIELRGDDAYRDP
jgi:hypothetical protein